MRIAEQDIALALDVMVQANGGQPVRVPGVKEIRGPNLRPRPLGFKRGGYRKKSYMTRPTKEDPGIPS